MINKAKALITKLGLMPPNVLDPKALAGYFSEYRHAEHSNDLTGLKAVGRSKAFLAKSYSGKRKEGPRIAIVGKGVTFDSGGISIKSAHRMSDMKFDMLGSATALGVGLTLEKYKGFIDIYGVIAENTFGENTMRPGDVLEYPDGTKVEIINTDAEGRLILADGILEAKKTNPDLLITIATLTGAAAAALGEATAVFGNNQNLVNKLLEASVAKKELAWQLPIWDMHRNAIKGQKGVADIVNQGTMAGASTAAAFLEHFVGKTEWLHLDIAGSAYKSGKPTGAMLETLTHFISKL